MTTLTGPATIITPTPPATSHQHEVYGVAMRTSVNCHCGERLLDAGQDLAGPALVHIIEHLVHHKVNGMAEAIEALSATPYSPRAPLTAADFRDIAEKLREGR